MEEDTILSLSDIELWRLFQAKKEDMIKNVDTDGRKDPIITKEDYEKVRFGFEIDFEIDDALECLFIRKPKRKMIVIHREYVNIKDYRTEMEKRRSLIINALLDYYHQEEDNIG